MASVPARAVAGALVSAVAAAPAAIAAPITFVPGDLAVTYSVYPGLINPYTASTGGYVTPDIVAGTTVLPINPPVTASNGGSYPGVFSNTSVDANFGVTSPIYLGQITPTGTMVSTTDLTALTGITTSFSSKSELSLNLSTNGSALTLTRSSGLSTISPTRPCPPTKIFRCWMGRNTASSIAVSRAIPFPSRQP
jgi:hypothetical protein